MANIVFKNAAVFDGTGSDTFNADVVVTDNRITQITTAGAFVAPADYEIIDCAGHILMPGMTEAHAHISWPSSVERFVPDFIQKPDEMMLIATQNARILLESGFTSAYSAGALGERLEVVIRDNINKGYFPGPRFRASTLERSPEGEAEVTGGVSHGRGPEAIANFVKKCKEMTIDQLKLVLSGEDALVPGSSQHILYTEEEVNAAHKAAQECGLELVAHAQAAEAVKMALRNGVRVIYHCSYADEEALDMLEAAKDWVFVAPAIGVIVATLEATPPPHIDMTSMKEMAKPVIENTKKLIPELKKRGVRVLPGGDYGFPFNPNGTNARDLEHFVNLYGYTSQEALMAATKLGGEIMGMADELGLIKENYLADILVIKGDVTKDVKILQNKDNIRIIMKDGKFVKRPMVPAQL